MKAEPDFQQLQRPMVNNHLSIKTLHKVLPLRMLARKKKFLGVGMIVRIKELIIFRDFPPFSADKRQMFVAYMHLHFLFL